MDFFHGFFVITIVHTLAAASPGPVYRMFRRCGHWLDPILGGAMVALGLKILVTKTS